MAIDTAIIMEKHLYHQGSLANNDLRFVKSALCIRWILKKLKSLETKAMQIKV